ncbi:WhiB family transcriptional regulator [Saccharopolyspora endophytica]|uniref:WhiB family transcriptional regulator n=1 Tax=Saccharopolyspora endophytica TaxID=543886 RepID=A0ABS5DA10_9PSEU|nr:WhiB family transcriptional regulator [Saccharopolyspora endophytica]MBQ0923087.1 WhiB family transcriptional regulator [Saccharopolyspora endophytica]
MKDPVKRYPEVFAEGKCVRQPFSADWFHDDARGGRAVERQRSRARQACSGCPLRPQCLAMALEFEADDGHSWGIWGGVSARDRREVLQALAASGAPRNAVDFDQLAENVLEPYEATQAQVIPLPRLKQQAPLQLVRWIA